MGNKKYNSYPTSHSKHQPIYLPTHFKLCWFIIWLLAGFLFIISFGSDIESIIFGLIFASPLILVVKHIGLDKTTYYIGSFLMFLVNCLNYVMLFVGGCFLFIITISILVVSCEHFGLPLTIIMSCLLGILYQLIRIANK